VRQTALRAVDITMPQFAESVVSATIGKWLKKPGDPVEEYEPICEVITDKVTAELPSTVSGVMLDILVPEGETVDVGTVVCRIGTAAEAGAAGEAGADGPSGAAESGAADAVDAPGLNGDQSMRHRHSPAVRKLAEEHGIDLRLVPGTGIGGRITRKDVLRYVESGAAATPAAAAGRGAAPAPGTAGGSAAAGRMEVPGGTAFRPAAPGSPAAGGQPAASAHPAPRIEVREHPAMPEIVVEPPTAGEREYFIDVTPIRKTIANRMRQSVQEIPHAWTSIEVDVTNLTKLRNKVKDEFKRNEGVNLTYMAFLIKAVVSAIKDYPIMNSVWSEDKIIVKRDINISLAVGTEDSVLTPVIRNADQKNIVGIAREVEDLARRTREGKLRPQDMQGGTFTINNTGTFGSILSYPIINYPQAAILTMEKIVKKPVVMDDDMIAIRSVVNLCLSFDHRILDGVICGRFHQRVKHYLESYGPDTNLYY
jgi:2-oxoisovalerate dehydrogenase E2 component (dihydrolipoyl transacylase)